MPKLKILVAEDNLASRDLIREMLEIHGFEVVEAADGQEAAQKLQEVKPDLVITDLQMPRLDGYGLLREIRRDERWASLPVVALTAYAMQGDREKALDAGFDAYVSKPISRAALMTAIGRLVNSTRPIAGC